MVALPKPQRLTPNANVLSLFDGISCGQLALNKAGLSYASYRASEIDIDAISIARKHYPNTIHLGDVRSVLSHNQPKIHLLLGGSPCQSFSFAGKNKGFKDPRGNLFYEYVRLKNELKPDFFLLENVRMPKKDEKIISDALGVNPVLINSNLVSAQNRRRLYWTNIKFKLPKDKNVHLKDILDTDVEYLNQFKVPKTPSRISMWQGKCKNVTNADKSSCVCTKQDRWSSQGLLAFDDFCRFFTPEENERLQTIPTGYTKGFSAKKRDYMIGNAWTVDVVAHILSFLK